jgi:hypothetical protein
MRRGLPRPLNAEGLPIPYVAAASDRLGKADLMRVGETLRDGLCQICGLVIEWPAYVVVKTDEPEWWPNGRLLQGPIHTKACAPLAFGLCPYLLARQGYELLLIEVDGIDLRGHLAASVDRETVRIPPEAFPT